MILKPLFLFQSENVNLSTVYRNNESLPLGPGSQALEKYVFISVDVKVCSLDSSFFPRFCIIMVVLLTFSLSYGLETIFSHSPSLPDDGAPGHVRALARQGHRQQRSVD